MTEPRGALTAAQYAYLLNPLRSTRVATRRQGGKDLSYLESWDVRAHLTRIFGFGNFDVRTLSTEFMGDFPYKGREDKPMIEAVYRATVELTVRAEDGLTIAVYSESAVGSATGAAEGAGRGDLHDNALKSATSDAMKRCAINLGTQFGLSLYDNGSKNDVIRHTLVKPEGVDTEEKRTPEQEAALAGSLGVTKTTEAVNQ